MFKFLASKVVQLRKTIAHDLGGGGDVEKPFIEHLEDLRKMIVRSVITVLITTVLCFVFEKELLGLFSNEPLRRANLTGVVVPSTIGTVESFNMSIRVAFTTAVVFAFPIVLFFLLQFVLPGLRHAEKKILWPSLAVGVGLFLIGAAFGYFIIVPQMLEFFHSWDIRHDLRSEWRLADLVKMVSNFVLLSGLAFELPVLIMALVKLEFLNYKVMSKNRGIALIIICTVAAIITPSTDAMSLGMLAGPMYILFEVCIWLAWGMERRDRRLHPDIYKDIEDIEVRDDWDTEEYNPFSELDRDQDSTSRGKVDAMDDFDEVESDTTPPLKDEYQRRLDAAAAESEAESQAREKKEAESESGESEPMGEADSEAETNPAGPAETGSDIEAALRRDAEAAGIPSAHSPAPESPTPEPEADIAETAPSSDGPQEQSSAAPEVNPDAKEEPKSGEQPGNDAR